MIARFLDGSSRSSQTRSLVGRGITTLAFCLLAASATHFLGLPSARAYVEVPMSFGAIVGQATTIVVMRVEKVDRDRNMIIYSKVRDLKGKHPTETIKHNIAKKGFHEREWKAVMEWAEVGKTAVFFHNGSASETCIGTYWYQAYPAGEWWDHSHGEPFLLRSFAGKPEKLISLVTEFLAGKEVIVPCMVDGNKDDLHLRRAKMQRLRASLKLQDYNPKRDFVSWGGAEDFVRLDGIPGFTHQTNLANVGSDAQAIAPCDYDGDGKIDLCLVGPNRVVLVHNDGESMSEASLPVSSGARAACWADYNADGRPDLFLACLDGPRLLTNEGASFRDDSHLLPREASYYLTAAAWMDHDLDGRPDLLLANGFLGLRLFRNVGPAEPGKDSLVLGKWHVIGPFDNPNGKGFDTVYPPEKEVDLSKQYEGKGQKVAWRELNARDGESTSLAIFNDNNNAVAYLTREITVGSAMDLPVSLGSDDTLTVWLNGERLHAENVYRAVGPDQAKLTLKLREGKNTLLLKICQGGGEWGFYFAALRKGPPPVTWKFEDVSSRMGLGVDGLGSASKGDALCVADVDADGRPDFLYAAGKGHLFLNKPDRFVEAESGVSFQAGRVGPTFADYDGDGKVDLFVPRPEGSKLFRNLGAGKFHDVTAAAGDLAKPTGEAVGASFGDFFNDGRQHLALACLRGPNRIFRNQGDGKFSDETEKLGLHRRVLHSQAVSLVDLNGDGVLDLVCLNESSEALGWLGNKDLVGKLTPVTVRLANRAGLNGATVRVLDKAGRQVAARTVGEADGRGGQAAFPLARFALPPVADLTIEVMTTDGKKSTLPLDATRRPLAPVVAGASSSSDGK